MCRKTGKNRISKKLVIVVLSILLLIIVLATLFLTLYKDNDAFIHISFDDTITVFEDLTTNASTYDTIFDNDFLAYLKSLHDDYGAVFSLYCFYENDHFNLSQATNKFASEFESNADWLKVGYHGTNINEKMANLNSSDAIIKYKTLLNELIRITGGTAAIDTVPRLHSFSANKKDIIAISKVENGPTGFLSADDHRNSYYFTGEENTFIDMNDFFRDDNDICFVSTDLRLENTPNPYSSLMKIADDEKQNKCIEVFTHEKEYGELMKLKLWATCQFAYEEGYSWDFPMYRYAQ